MKYIGKGIATLGIWTSVALPCFSQYQEAILVSIVGAIIGGITTLGIWYDD